MKYIIKLLLIFSNTLFLLNVTFGQSDKVIKEVGNGIFISFPKEPTYSTTVDASTYVAKSQNCIFIVIIQRNVIPNYASFTQLQKSEQDKISNILLDNVIKGKLAYTNNTSNSSIIRIGNYLGRQCSYNAINPVNGERGNRYCKLILVNDKLYNFNCWYLNNNSSNEEEKDLFLNSISVN